MDEGNGNGEHGNIIAVHEEYFKQNIMDHKQNTEEHREIMNILIGHDKRGGLVSEINEIRYRNRIFDSIRQIIVGILASVVTAVVLRLI
jgi:predicted RNA binding protein with dsRBD fold (UPF0201 family)